MQGLTFGPQEVGGHVMKFFAIKSSISMLCFWHILPIFSQNRSSEMSNFLALIYDNGELWGKYT